MAYHAYELMLGFFPAGAHLNKWMILMTAGSG